MTPVLQRVSTSYIQGACDYAYPAQLQLQMSIQLETWLHVMMQLQLKQHVTEATTAIRATGIA